ncbi:family 16 glycosylhydrolase [Hirschia litorea]|uniref:Family 16 glycosylhydrolase n=1 Tax=Hirschia litorea TaxID=1199156 RepID=A0ABW2INW3_9PROT
MTAFLKTSCKLTASTVCIAIALAAGCAQNSSSHMPETVASTWSEKPNQFSPSYDPENSEGWVLNAKLSDEFNGDKLDESKWYVNGTDGYFYHWKGRAPSQFAPHNVRVEDGMMKLTSRWEPDYEFVDETTKSGKFGDDIAPVTAAAVISKNRFLHGYMEVRSKSMNAAMTSAFWTLGYQSELDIYEQIGNPKVKNGSFREDHYTSAIHDWRPGRSQAGEFANNKSFHNAYDMKTRTADAFHVYGCEWSEAGLKFYLDGKLIHETSRETIGDGWVITNPLEIWFDSEIFNWLGYPHAEELPADYEVDYVRVWQKPNANLLDRAFFGFEGPITDKTFPQPPQDVRGNMLVKPKQRFWKISDEASKYVTIQDDIYRGGKSSLLINVPANSKSGDVRASSHKGDAVLGAGDYVLKMDVRVDDSNTLKRLYAGFDKAIAFDLTQLEKGEWTTVSHAFSADGTIGSKAGFSISASNVDLEGQQAKVFIDNISVEAAS